MSLSVIQYELGGSHALPGIELGSQRIIFADPPYNIGVKYADDPTRDRLSKDEYFDFCDRALRQLSPYLCPGGTLWWLCLPAHADEIGPLLTKNIGPRQYMIVKEESFAQYQQKTLTEDFRLLYCHQNPGGPITFNGDGIRVPSERQRMGDKRADPRGRVPGRVWKIRRLQGTSDDRVDWHCCQLAPELLSRVVLGWSNAGDSIMDAFAGSGNMGLVCRATGRSFVGIDKSPTYVQKMKERLGIAA